MGRRTLEPGQRSIFRTFRVGPTLNQQLLLLAQERRTSVSEVIREALEAYAESARPQASQEGAADVLDLFEDME